MNFWHMIDSFFYINKETKKLIQKIMQFVFFIVLIIFIAVVIYFGYKQYTFRKEAAAQQSLAHVMTLFKDYNNKTTADKSQDLESIVKEIKEARESNKNSSLAPYFSQLLSKIYASDKQNNTEALKVLEEGILEAQDSLTKNILKTNHALMLLDLQDAELHKEGINELRNLIDDTENPIRDISQFYLGKYFWIKNDIEMAKMIWQQFLDEQAQNRIAPSPFVSEVQLSLSSLV